MGSGQKLLDARGAGCGCAPASQEQAASGAPSPIACTLVGDDFAKRTAWIRQLAKEHLVSARRGPLSLDLAYSPAAADIVQDMVAKERACCAFLNLDLSETPESVHVRIIASEEAREIVDTLFDHLAPSPA